LSYFQRKFALLHVTCYTSWRQDSTALCTYSTRCYCCCPLLLEPRLSTASADYINYLPRWRQLSYARLEWRWIGWWGILCVVSVDELPKRVSLDNILVNLLA